MSTLETQYKNFRLNNPESTFSFGQWQRWKFSEELIKSIKDAQDKNSIEIDEKHENDEIL